MNIVLKDITVKYPYEDFCLLENFSVAITNDITTLLIDRQSGKTTIAKLLMGLMKPNSGNIFVDGMDWLQVKPKDKQVAYLPYPPLLFGGRSVSYNLRYPLKVRRLDKQQQLDIVSKVANQAQLTDYLQTKAKKIPLNLQIKLAVARIMVRKINFVLMDDSIHSLDDATKQMLIDYCQQHNVGIINLTSNINNAIGHTILIQHSNVIAQGDIDTVSKAKQQLLWLYDNEVMKNDKQV